MRRPLRPSIRTHGDKYLGAGTGSSISACPPGPGAWSFRRLIWDKGQYAFIRLPTPRAPAGSRLPYDVSVHSGERSEPPTSGQAGSSGSLTRAGPCLERDSLDWHVACGDFGTSPGLEYPDPRLARPRRVGADRRSDPSRTVPGDLGAPPTRSPAWILGGYLRFLRPSGAVNQPPRPVWEGSARRR